MVSVLHLTFITNMLVLKHSITWYAILLYSETTTFTIVEELPDDYTDFRINEESGRIPSKIERPRQNDGNPNYESLDSGNNRYNQEEYYEKSSYIANRNNVSVEDVISTRINDNFQNNFPNSIQVYNDIVLPTKETALKELRSAAATAPKGY